MNHTAFCFSCLLLFAVAPLSSAQNLYVGASVGSSKFDGSQFGDSSSAWGVLAGWNLNDYFGLELGFTDQKEFDSRVPGQTSPDTNSLSLSAVVKYPVLSGLEVFGKIGFTRINTDVVSSNSFYTGSLNDNSQSYGVGVQFEFSDNWKIRVSFDRAQLELGLIPAGSFYVHSDGNLDTVSAGLIFGF